jgi:hypothetical protein
LLNTTALWPRDIFGDVPFAAKVLCSDAPFSKPGIQSYYTVFQRGENDDPGLIIRGEDIRENSCELERDGCKRCPYNCWVLLKTPFYRGGAFLNRFFKSHIKRIQHLVSGQRCQHG